MCPKTAPASHIAPQMAHKFSEENFSLTGRYSCQSARRGQVRPPRWVGRCKMRLQCLRNVQSSNQLKLLAINAIRNRDVFRTASIIEGAADSSLTRADLRLPNPHWIETRALHKGAAIYVDYLGATQERARSLPVCSQLIECYRSGNILTTV